MFNQHNHPQSLRHFNLRAPLPADAFIPPSNERTLWIKPSDDADDRGVWGARGKSVWETGILAWVMSAAETLSG